jgi:hypothetical protein
MSLDQLQKISYLLDQPQPNWQAIQMAANIKSSWWTQLTCKLWGNEPSLFKITQLLNQALIYQEQKGIKIFGQPIDPQRVKSYEDRFELYRQMGQKLQELLPAKRSSALQQEYQNLQCHLIGLNYSLGKARGGFDKLEQADPDALALLKEAALSWKKRQPLATENCLNRLEAKQLENAACYPKWVQFALGDQKLSNEFFKWALRDYNAVDVFVMAPHTQKQIKGALMSGMLGRIRKPHEAEPLAFAVERTKTEQVFKRVLTLPIYHGSYKQFEAEKQKRVNILNPNCEVTFQNGNYTLSVQEIWNEMAQRSLREAKINLCAWGLINFHPVFGPWDAKTQQYIRPPMNKNNWTQFVPPSDIVTQTQLQKAYQVKDRDLFFKVVATREARSLYALNCHGYMQIYVRLNQDQWKVLDIGAWAYRFQSGLWDGLKLFCHTVERVISLMDQNGGYSHRQRSAYPIFPNQEEATQILDRLYAAIQRKGVFQFGGKNCSYPIQKSIEKSVKSEPIPNFFRLPAWKAKTSIGPIDKSLALLGRCPQIIQRIGFHLLIGLLGSHRGTWKEDKYGNQKWQSLRQYFGWSKPLELYHAGYLPYQIERDRQRGSGAFAKGELYWGNTAHKD